VIEDDESVWAAPLLMSVESLVLELWEEMEGTNGNKEIDTQN
jgi:hypothetical protein